MCIFGIYGKEQELISGKVQELFFVGKVQGLFSVGKVHEQS